MDQFVATPSLTQLAPVGHYFAIRIGFAFPVTVENSLPQPWVDQYTRCGFMLQDPVMAWMYANTGWVRWSDLSTSDDHGVLSQARSFGLTYGVSVCTVDGVTNERSFGSFCRADREFTATEAQHLLDHVTQLHLSAARPNDLTTAELEALRMVRDGRRFKEIAHDLRISESAVKARLTNAKKKLGAKTSVQAVSIATQHHLL